MTEIAPAAPAVTPIDEDRWIAMPKEIGYPAFDLIDAEGGVTAENIPVERDARLMALTPDLVCIVLRVAPMSDAASKIRKIVGEDEFKRLVGRS